jgi:hypothetical protein
LGEGKKTNQKAIVDTCYEEKRLAWTNKYRSWTTDDWKKVPFSDESHFFVLCYRASIVRRSSDEPVRVEHFQQTVKYLPKNVLGFFTASGSGSPAPVDGIMNSSKHIKILKSRVLPFLQTFADGKGTFQYHLAQCHNSKKQSRSSFKKTKSACSIGLVILQT